MQSKPVASQKPLFGLLAVTLLFGAVPFGLYAGSRLARVLPNRAQWKAQAGFYSHGPWCYEWQNVVLVLCWLALAVALPLGTWVQSIVAARRSRSIAPVAFGVLLTTLQWSMAFSLLWFMAWTID